MEKEAVKRERERACLSSYSYLQKKKKTPKKNSSKKMARFARALTGVCLITLFLLVSSQDADAAKRAKKVKADETVTNKVRERRRRKGV